MTEPARAIKSKKQIALDTADLGLCVFPIVPNAKSPPLIPNWQNEASNNHNRVNAWWDEWPDANIGVCTNGLMLIDVDIKKGGREAFEGLLKQAELLGDPMPSTWAVRTTTGGAHLYFALPQGVTVANSVEHLCKGVDVRGEGGYVVAPGSTIGDKEYAWKGDYAPAKRVMAEAPQWLVDLSKKPIAKDANAGVRIVEEDEIALARADEYLRRFAPEAIQGGRDDIAFRLAARLYDEGISQPECLERLTSWNETHCHPPLDLHELQRLAWSAQKNRSKPIGVKHPNAPGMDVHEIAPRPVEAQVDKPLVFGNFHAVRADKGAQDARSRAQSDYLIKGVIDRGMSSVLIGAPGGGKTFLVLDMSYHIAAGKEWNGVKVKQGAVVYLALEAGKLILRRLAALEHKYGPMGDTPLFVVPCPADLAHGNEDTGALIALLRAIEKASGHKIELVVIDTLARAISGGDESSSKDMGAVIKAVDYIRAALDCHGMLIHHPGLAAPDRGRGSSNVFGAVDTEMVVTNKVLKFTKQRDGEKGDPIRFSLKLVRIGVDDEGGPITSCTVSLVRKGEAGERIPLTAAEQQVYDRVMEALDKADLPDDSPFDLSFAQHAVRKSDSERLPAKSTLSEHVRSCSEKGWFEKLNNHQWVVLRSETFGNVRN